MHLSAYVELIGDAAEDDAELRRLDKRLADDADVDQSDRRMLAGRIAEYRGAIQRAHYDPDAQMPEQFPSNDKGASHSA